MICNGKRILIAEGVAEAKQKYLDTGLVPQEVFDLFVRSDTTKNKKYVEWMCKQYSIIKERPEHIKDVALLFDQFASKNKTSTKDIYSLSLEQAEKEIEEASKKESKSEQEKKVKEEGAKLVYEDDVQKVYHITTHAASCLYGAGTKWCTTSSEVSSYFHNYHQKANLYYAISKVKTMIVNKKRIPVKVAILRYFSGSTEYYDPQDKSINKETYYRLIGYKNE